MTVSARPLDSCPFKATMGSTRRRHIVDTNLLPGSDKLNVNRGRSQQSQILQADASRDFVLYQRMLSTYAIISLSLQLPAICAERFLDQFFFAQESKVKSHQSVGSLSVFRTDQKASPRPLVSFFASAFLRAGSATRYASPPTAAVAQSTSKHVTDGH